MYAAIICLLADCRNSETSGFLDDPVERNALIGTSGTHRA